MHSHHHHHHHGYGPRGGNMTRAGTKTDSHHRSSSSSHYSVRIKALFKIDPTLLGHDISRILADDNDQEAPFIVDELLEQLEECKREILRVLSKSRGSHIVTRRDIVVASNSYRYFGGRYNSRYDYISGGNSGSQTLSTTALVVWTPKAVPTTTWRYIPSSVVQTTTVDNAISQIFPTEILRQVAQSEYLSVKELGRFLLLVSKGFVNDLGSDQVWKILCCNEWKNTCKIPRHLIDVRGYQWLFQQRVYNSLSGGSVNVKDGERPKRRVSQVSSSSSSSGLLFAQNLSPNTLFLLTSIWKGSTEVASLTFTADPLSTLVTTGELNVKLENPIPLGEFPINPDSGVIDFNGSSAEGEFDDWHATIHVIRLDEFKCCCIHETSSCSWGEYDYIVDPTNSQNSRIYNENGSRHDDPNKRQKVDGVGDGNDEVDDTGVEVDMGYLDFSPNTDGMEFTGLGKALLSRIREYDTHSDKLVGIRLDATLLCFTKGFQPNASSVQLSFSELRLEVWKSYMEGSAVLFNSTSESQKHGVTLLHLFDHLVDF